MTTAEMLAQSGILTLLGVTVVFVFLLIMIIFINLSGRLIHKLGLDKDVREITQKAEAPAAPAPVPGAVIAAITAAVTEYRKNKTIAAITAAVTEYRKSEGR